MGAIADVAPIRLEGVTVRRGNKVVLRDISLELDTGIVAVVGANGSGKTTLLRAILGLVDHARGRVLVNGRAIGETRARGLNSIGYLAQEADFPRSARVADAVEYAARLQQMPSGDIAPRVRTVLETLDLCEWSDRRLRTLSGGTRQRVHLAQALVHEPDILLLDEPTVGVDLEHRVAIREAIRVAAHNRLVVMTTHLSEDLEYLATQVVVLSEGRLRWVGTPEGIPRIDQQGQRATLLESVVALAASDEGHD